MTNDEKARLLERLAEQPGVTADERALLLECARLFVPAAATSEPVAAPKRARSPAKPAKPTKAAEAGGGAILWSDGAARGNPGPAGIGAVLKTRDGEPIARVSQYLGTATNNVAEYRALLRGLDEAIRCGVTEIEVRADSELLIKQLKGEYRVKDEKLKPLYQEAKQRLAQFQRYRLTHVRREYNTEADELANHGIDARVP
jgi:ribonuclease HI